MKMPEDDFVFDDNSKMSYLLWALEERELDLDYANMLSGEDWSDDGLAEQCHELEREIRSIESKIEACRISKSAVEAKKSGNSGRGRWL
jgi:hypothetical protein